jgi:predicted GTPase
LSEALWSQRLTSRATFFPQKIRKQITPILYYSAADFQGVTPLGDNIFGEPKTRALAELHDPSWFLEMATHPDVVVGANPRTRLDGAPIGKTVSRALRERGCATRPCVVAHPREANQDGTVLDCV